MTPYYDDGQCVIYHANCLESFAWVSADVLITDPPYGRAWRQGDTNTTRGWKSNRHDGIVGDSDTTTRDRALILWGERPAIVFGDLTLPPPAGTKLTLVYDKGTRAGFAGAIGGYRRNAEGIYLIGSHGSGLGGRSAILSSKQCVGGNFSHDTGHPHTKPIDVVGALVLHAPPGVVADPFMGSGSTLVAAKAQGRSCIGVEIEERYCEIAATRLAQGVLDFGGVA